ncbi:unnamed protein product [Anisakis simplex]|uniref:HTH_Tnp_IS1 domain-containing protein n=1 Tax=Anisakis simplex TaxID=6269 RepID=A0A0M3JSG3_ANISI|nr:unnamed protein product [Anisakis simplex]
MISTAKSPLTGKKLSKPPVGTEFSRRPPNNVEEIACEVGFSHSSALQILIGNLGLNKFSFAESQKRCAKIV